MGSYKFGTKVTGKLEDFFLVGGGGGGVGGLNFAIQGICWVRNFVVTVLDERFW